MYTDRPYFTAQMNVLITAAHSTAQNSSDSFSSYPLLTAAQLSVARNGSYILVNG